MILSLGGLGAGAACPNSGWADQRHGLGIIHCPGQLQRQQLLCQHCAGGNHRAGDGGPGFVTEHHSGHSSGMQMGRLQGTHCLGDTLGGRGCPGQSSEHNGEDTESTTPPRAAAGPAPRGSIPVPGITSCLAPDPITPTTASQSLQGPSGPSAVTEMQIKGCGFKNVINKDLQCPEEHLQAGR